MFDHLPILAPPPRAAVYTMGESVYTIDYLFCNTQTAGQLQSQNVVVKVRFREKLNSLP